MLRCKLSPRPLHRAALNGFSSVSRLQNLGPMVSQLQSRSVIALRGPDTVKFLQGLLTNDVRRLEGPSAGKGVSSSFPTLNMPMASAPPLYAAMLTPHGRFLYDFFLYKPSRPDEMLDRTGSGPGPKPEEELELLADVDSAVVDELLQTLKRYRLRSKVEIESVGEEFKCWQRYGGEISSSEDEPDAASVGWGASVDQSAVSSSQGNDKGWRWFRDPRLHSLGFRGIFPSNSTPPLVEADKEADEQNFKLWRLERGVAEGSNEIPKGEAVPLEYNLAGLNAISFDKGCYVGQELIARAHHRGTIRKRLLPVRLFRNGGKDADEGVAPGLVVVDAASGKKEGTVTTALGSRALALLRLEDVFKESTSLSIEGNRDLKVEVNKPDWWPAGWSPEYHEHTAVV